MTILLKHWRTFATIIAFVCFISLLAWAGLTIGGWHDQAAKVPVLQASLKACGDNAASAKASVDKAIELNKTVETDHANEIAKLDRRLAADRLQPARCIPLRDDAYSPSRAAGGILPAGPVPNGDGGIDRATLIEFAGRCDKVGLAYDGLRTWVKGLEPVKE